MNYNNMIEPIADTGGKARASIRSGRSRSKAVGLVRPELSGSDLAAHALDIQCHAYHLGYQWIYTVRPPERTRDPVEYVLGIAASMHAGAIIVVSLAHIDSRPELINAGLDLVTITPPRLWRCGSTEPIVVQSVPLNDCTWEPTQLERDCARRLWDTHRDCLPDCRARLAASAALSALDEVD